jgi:bacillolysin
MKKNSLLLVLLAIANTAFAQQKKSLDLPQHDGSPRDLGIRRPEGQPSVPTIANPFGLPPANFSPIGTLARTADGSTQLIRTQIGKSGLPIAFEGRTAASTANADTKSGAERALDYVASLAMPAVKSAATEFVPQRTQVDEQGNTHVRLQQVVAGIPVYGGELVAHSKGAAFEMLTGRYFPTPVLAQTTPQITAEAAIETVKSDFGLARVKAQWSAQDLRVIGGQPYKTELVVYHQNNDFAQEKLAWHIEAHPNLMQRAVYFVDARTGEVLHHFDHNCNLAGLLHDHAAHATKCVESDEMPLPAAPAAVNGPVPASGQDLFNVVQNFGAWQVGSQILLEDSSLPMFNGPASNMPNEPVGAIITLDALNTSPEQQSSFDYDFVTSATTTFSNKKAVSAHINAVKSYNYFWTTHSRKSIDGVGGNIISFINVAEGDGSSMENAFWNGAAMWYGNGGSTFKELARGLDVGGHEMTHGVIEKTANLEYQNESGALNESFADVFAAMIDNNDWLIGEDVMKPNINPNNCLRNMQDPHNGVSSNSPWYQPKHTNEQFTGSGDNGGVHINSGITNHAFYLFATNAAVGKAKAEKVYYKALNDYLVKSSQFEDCRIAVVQAATDLYGASVATAAAQAFDAVGIAGPSGGGTNNYLGTLSTNPGADLILCTTNDDQKLDLANGSGTVLGTIYDQGLSSRPSITDDGRQIVFVNTEGHIITVDLAYNGTNITPTVNPPLSNSPEWRNAAISKDGRFLAALTKTKDNYIYIFELVPPFGDNIFELYNPTYSNNGDVTYNVNFADVIEFDYSGQYLMYDAENDLSNGQNNLSYWDIGFLNFADNSGLLDPADASIAKLFSGLPDNVSIGNPSFSKNSPFIIAFDYIDGNNDQNDIYAANVETGDYGVILANNGSLGWPNYNRLDKEMIYEGPNSAGQKNIYKQGVKDSKIEGLGNETSFISNRHWGVWFGTGMRSLQVGTTEQGTAFEDIKAYPNPTGDRLTVSLQSTGAAQNTAVQVFNTAGQQVFSTSIDVRPGQNTFDLDLQPYTVGTYLLRVVSPQGVAILKLSRQ